MKARLLTILAAAALTACATGPVAPETTKSKIVEESNLLELMLADTLGIVSITLVLVAVFLISSS